MEATVRGRGAAARPSVRGSLLWSGLSGAGAQLVSFAAFAALARTLGRDTFGLVALAGTMVDLLLVLSSAGIADALVQRPELAEEDADTAFWANLALGLAFCGVALALAGPIARAYRRPDLEPVVRALSLVFVLTPLGATHAAVLTRRMDFRALAARNMAANLLGAGVGVGLAAAGCGAWALVGQRLALAGALAALAWRAARWTPRPAFRPAALAAFMRFGGFLSVSQLLVMLNGRVAELLGGAFAGPGAVAVLRAGARAVDALNQLTFAPFHQVSMPMQARVQHDPAARDAVHVQLSRASALLMFPTFLGLGALAPPVTVLLFGPGWAGAATAVRLMTLAVFPLQFNVLFIAALTAAGRSRLVLGWSAAQAALGVAMALAASPWGWEAMLGANVLRAYLLLPCALWTQTCVLGVAVGPVVRSVRPAGLAALAMAAAVAALEHATAGRIGPAAQVALLVPVGVALFGGLLLAQDRTGPAALRDLWRARRAAA